MDVKRDHIIHSKGGVLGEGVTSVSDGARIAEQAFRAGTNGSVVLHFHGGLVGQDAAEGIAERLAIVYSKAGAYPVFSVWESGFTETIRNNLGDILHDKVFQEIFKKVSEWVLRKGTSTIATRGAGQSLNKQRFRQEMDDWLNGRTPVPPIIDQPPPTGAVTRDIGVDEAELAQEIHSEFETDPTFEATIAGLALAAGRVTPLATKGLDVKPLDVSCQVDQRALNEMFPKQAHATKGGIAWFAVARFVAKVVVAVVRRYFNKRDHGAYTTIVEEVLRAVYLDKVGQVIWNQMKKDASVDAFGQAGGAGEVVLQTWKALAEAGVSLPRVTLVGHSTGAIYINGWIARSAQLIPSLKYDVVFLAPACRSQDFVTMYEKNKAWISRIRVFGMKDSAEQLDRLVPIIYPRSLLYFVSGVVEGDVDVPLLGMQRFIADPATFSENYMNSARDLLNIAKAAVWSVSDSPDGLGSASLSHGDFDNDEATLASLSHIVSRGY
jgi:hypothetical protein